jgi:chaperonin cofactor prefoldin
MWFVKHRSKGHVVSLLLIALSLLVAVLLIANRQQVVDQITVWQYKPSQEISSFAEKSGMSDTGKFYYYASQPSLESTQDFNAKCGRTEASTAILGCYSSQKIYIYNVTDARLDGIKSVTAAHEMLHAAYERLSGSERDRINKLLESEYQKFKDDADLTERMAFYERTEPGQQNNELHSVLGAEIADLSPDLEKYFARYFSDRSKVTKLHDSYSAVFEGLQDRAETLSTRLHELGNAIEEGTAAYNTDVEQLNRDIGRFNSRAENGGFDSQAQFENERSDLMARADQLEATRTLLNDNINEYETLRQELSTIAAQSEELNRSINSSLAPAPSL